MVFVLLLSMTSSYAGNWTFNNPYPDDDALEKIYYSSFAEQPKTLDPAKSYSSNEYQFIMQIYEPLLQYDYFIRPYQLEPLTASTMPQIRFLNKAHESIPDSKNGDVAYTVYTIHIRSGIFFQPHPAFAKNKKGQYLYHQLSADYLDNNDINKLSDFAKTGTREVTADDYIYQIKRLASPAVNSPIYGLMSEHIVGFRDFAQSLPDNLQPLNFLDLRKYPMAGVQKIDDYTFEVTITGQYSQFLFWLAMPFFAPVPWEADRFYSQVGMDDKNLSFDWYPVGTGPFMLSENNPNRRMVLSKNPNFRQEFFPSHGSEEDKKAGYLEYAGKPLPLVNRAIYTLEKESIPRWNKFLQGYYDLSGISADSFDQAIQINSAGLPTLTPSMQDKKIRLSQTTDPTIYYLGFNMLDPIVGGTSERARKLRLAISIAVNFDESIAIFYNGRGNAAQGPIPPGIFGYKEGAEGINPYVYRWDGSKPARRPLKDAKFLMKQAGYPGGIDPKTGEALILHYDVPITGGPDDKAQLDWMRKQFAKIGIDLNIRATQYNRFQDKMRSGNAQIYSWGWNADYPDPENFLFMLYGANGKVKHNGENASNYENLRYDRLFELMRNRKNDAERQKLIDSMVEIVRHDAPWAWGINTQTLILTHQWVSPTKPNTISLNGLKYMNVDVPRRNQLRELWNKPVLWPIGLLILFGFLLLLPLLLAYYQKERRHAPRIKK
ncbi:ABC transporter substrate-binding protein [Legionella cardiaca]|uniref:ABC transporter substrate-binding protein n=1 Tax=Legionella cardiaca TaxID=1071983 RepID=A0ABY8AZZ0_9GAMM|nr:ABC transporter substrate-binding protein [Legionella cardiaca]WED44662.1 ABC transporter substrate-binding protein [Legionella cardiaca]